MKGNRESRVAARHGRGERVCPGEKGDGRCAELHQLQRAATFHRTITYTKPPRYVLTISVLLQICQAGLFLPSNSRSCGWHKNRANPTSTAGASSAQKLLLPVLLGSIHLCLLHLAWCTGHLRWELSSAAAGALSSNSSSGSQGRGVSGFTHVKAINRSC